MKIAIVAANGRSGQLIAKEAVNRGHDVTAIVRGENKSAAQHALIKDLFDLASADLAGFDVVVDAFGAWTPETLPGHKASARLLSDLLAGTDTRLIAVGGAGSLFMDASHTVKLEDTPDFPDSYKPVSKATGEALAEIRNTPNLKWTYISPAADFQADGERTGAYELADEEFTANKDGQSYISYADYAIAVVDEAERAAHVGERISVYTA